VISNLLRNSAEAAANGRPIRVSVAGRLEAGKLQLSLTDNGHGIPADDLPKIFIPFFTTKANGTGLGLALVHRIITEHGGSITVDSGSEGTTFTVTLPTATAVSGVEASRIGGAAGDLPYRSRAENTGESACRPE
jgi:signal transduction histidine kinase